MATTIESILDDFIQTKQEAVVFIGQLDELLDAIFATTVPFVSLCEKKISVIRKEKLLAILEAEKVNITEKNTIAQCLTRIKQVLSQKPVLELILAFEPKQETVSKIRQWCYQQYKMVPLVSISSDPTLLGGCILRIDGHYKDYSVKKIFQEKQQPIFDTLSAYA